MIGVYKKKTAWSWKVVILTIVLLVVVLAVLVAALPEPPAFVQRCRQRWRPQGYSQTYHQDYNYDDDAKSNNSSSSSSSATAAAATNRVEIPYLPSEPPCVRPPPPPPPRPSSPQPRPHHHPSTTTATEYPTHCHCHGGGSDASDDEPIDIPPPTSSSGGGSGGNETARVAAAASLSWRSYDGSGNNLLNGTRGMRTMPLLRRCGKGSSDGGSGLAIRGPKNPSPRLISNSLCAEHPTAPPLLSQARCTDMLWAWGQFLDHEITLTNTNADESASMTTPSAAEDPTEQFPGRRIPFHRSKSIQVAAAAREQPSDISSFIDGTNVYGNDPVRAMALRRLDGSGKMKTSISASGQETLLPRNTGNLDNANAGGASNRDLFLAGDVRANENALLTALHTLFLREHNYMCDQAVRAHPQWQGKDEMIYQHARRLVTGEMQAITFGEFLPALLGQGSIPPYRGYEPSLDATMATEFSTAGYRFGHSAVSAHLKIGHENGDADFVGLRDVFFHPEYVHEFGADGLLLGATQNVMREINTQLVDDLRNFLFGPPSMSQLLDLAALNIQRGRDHALPGYNEMRRAYGLAARTTMSEVTSSSSLRQRLTDLYGPSPDHIDPWVGCLIEDHSSHGAQVGELARAIMREQFIRLRDGDRFWFQNDAALSQREKSIVSSTTLATVLRRNTHWSPHKFGQDVFHSK